MDIKSVGKLNNLLDERLNNSGKKIACIMIQVAQACY